MLKKFCKNIGIIMAVLFIGLLFGSQNKLIHAFTTNPTPTRQYVVDDYDDDLNDMTKEIVVHQEKHYKYDTVAKPQVVMMTVPNSNGESTAEYSEDLLNHSQWHFGSKDLNNGVLILFARNHGKNNVYISTGYGVEGILPDLKCENILEKHKKLLKSSSREKVNEGLQEVFFDVTKILNRKYAHLSKKQARTLAIKNHYKKFAKDFLYFIIAVIILVPPYDGNWFCGLWFALDILMIFGGSDDDDDGGSSGGFGDSGSGGSFGGGGAGI